jgi:hypothetical protein
MSLKLTSLDLSESRLEDWEDVGSQLKFLTKLETLQLNYSSIRSAAHLQSLCLEKLTSLRDLQLSYTRCMDGDEGQTLAKTIELIPTLESLSLCGVVMNDTRLQTILEALLSLTKLYMLALPLEGVTEASISHIVAFLRNRRLPNLLTWIVRFPKEDELRRHQAIVDIS